MNIWLQLVQVVLSAVSGLALLLLSPLLVEVVNVFREREHALETSEEIAEAYPIKPTKIFVCSACQTFWALLITVFMLCDNHRLPLFSMGYAPALLLWLFVKRAYRSLH